MNILLITPFIPYPLDSGGNQAFFSMVDSMRKQHSITIAVAIHRHQVKSLEELKKIWPDVTFSPYIYNLHSQTVKTKYPFSLNGLIYYIADSFGRKKARRLRKESGSCTDENIMIRKNSQLYSNTTIYEDGLIKHIRNLSNSGKFDLIQTEFVAFLPFVLLFPDNVYKVFVHHEIMFVRMKNELDLFPDLRIGEEFEYLREKNDELALLDRFDRIIVLTENDRNVLGEYLDKGKISVSPAVTTGISASCATFRHGKNKDFYILGNNLHYPNHDGVLWFCNNVIPELRRRGKGIKVHIIGKWENKTSEALSDNFPELEFDGYIENLEDFICDKISLVPIRIGSGMRMKILDAIKAYSPFITTTKGVEGQNFTNGRDCIIADTPEEFADAIIRLQEDESLQETLAGNALEKLRSSYNAQDMVSARLAIYNEIQSGLYPDADNKASQKCARS